MCQVIVVPGGLVCACSYLLHIWDSLFIACLGLVSSCFGLVHISG